MLSPGHPHSRRTNGKDGPLIATLPTRGARKAKTGLRIGHGTARAHGTLTGNRDVESEFKTLQSALVDIFSSLV